MASGPLPELSGLQPRANSWLKSQRGCSVRMELCPRFRLHAEETYKQRMLQSLKPCEVAAPSRCFTDPPACSSGKLSVKRARGESRTFYHLTGQHGFSHQQARESGALLQAGSI